MDLSLTLSAEMPFLWADPKTGAESIATEWLDAAVRIRHVPLAEMETVVHKRDGWYELALLHGGREYRPFSEHDLKGLEAEIGAGMPPLFKFLTQDLPYALVTQPRVAQERWWDYRRQNASFRPEAETLSWAARRVGELVIHDGRNLFRAQDRSDQSLAGRVANCALLALAEGKSLYKPGTDPAMERMARDLRRTAILARLDALPGHDLAAAAGQVRDFARAVGERHGAKTVREAMARIVASPDLAVAPPAADLASIGDLAP